MSFMPEKLIAYATNRYIAYKILVKGLSAVTDFSKVRQVYLWFNWDCWKGSYHFFIASSGRGFA